jgi:CO/xanthine dehydrogenase FAD-binding subunit
VQDVATRAGRTSLAPDELLVRIEIPKPKSTADRVTLFEKAGQPRAQTIATASVALVRSPRYLRMIARDGYANGYSRSI